MKPAYHNIGDAFSELLGLGLGMPSLSMDPSLSSSTPSSVSTPDSSASSDSGSSSGPVPFNLSLASQPDKTPFNLSMSDNKPQSNPFNLSTSPGSLNVAPQYAPPPSTPSDFKLKDAYSTPTAPQSAPSLVIPQQSVAQPKAAAGGGGMGMGINYGAGISSIFNSAGDIMQSYADKDAADAAAAQVKQQKASVDAQYTSVKRGQDLQSQLDATKASPAAQQKLKLAAARAAGVQGRQATFYQQHPESDPKVIAAKKAQEEKSKATQKKMVIAGVVAVVIGGGVWYFLKRRGKR